MTAVNVMLTIRDQNGRPLKTFAVTGERDGSSVYASVHTHNLARMLKELADQAKEAR